MTGDCRRCGAKASPPVEICKDGVRVAAGFMCDPCFAEVQGEVPAMQAKYDELLAAGVEVEVADRFAFDQIDRVGVEA